MAGTVPTGTDVALAAGLLRAGRLVAFPTETVYGLGADARNPPALRHLFAVKGRPLTHPVIVHVTGAGQLAAWARDIPACAARLAEAFWPGPLTLVLWRAAGVCDEVTGGQDTVGLRAPAAPLAAALLEAFGGGIAAPSANRFGRVSPTTAADVVADLGDDVAYVLDGGPCPVGVESTIVELTGPDPVVLRHGGVPAEAVEAVLGRPLVRVATGPARAPGMLPSHYAPSARVVLCEPDDVVATATAWAGRGSRVGVLAPAPVAGLPAGIEELPAAGPPDAYAHALYGRLRLADRLGLDVLVVVPPAPTGIGVAVRDRLARAAAPRGR